MIASCAQLKTCLAPAACWNPCSGSISSFTVFEPQIIAKRQRRLTGIEDMGRIQATAFVDRLCGRLIDRSRKER